MIRKKGVVAVAWFRRKDYQRIREISDDNMIPVFEDLEAKMAQVLAASAASGVVAEKVVIDPDELLSYAIQFHGGKIDSKVRGEFAASILLKNDSANR